MMARLLLLPALALLAACTETHSDNPAQISDTLTRSYVGRNAGDFFLKHGRSRALRTLEDGNHVYLWASAGGFDAEGGDARHYCEVHIRTDPGDVIEAIRVTVDTMGEWSASRCGELLYDRV